MNKVSDRPFFPVCTGTPARAVRTRPFARIRSRHATLLALAVGVFATACDDRSVTYYENVAPILRENCLSCHQADGYAPFPLASYEQVRDKAAAIAIATNARQMPPIPATADGSCQTFRSMRWLTDEEIAVITAWVRGGTPPGDPANDPGPPGVPPHLGNDSLSLTLSEPYTPNPAPGAQDDYRCFLLDPALATTKFITASEFLPEVRHQAHHIAMYTVDPAQQVGPRTNAEALAALDAADPVPGWDCYGSPGDGVLPRGLVGVYAPGTTVTEMPPETGLALHAGDVVVVQIHYHVSGGSEADRSTIKLRLADNVARPAVSVFRDALLESLFQGNPATLDPGRTDVQFQWDLPAAELFAQVAATEGQTPTSLELFGVAPHEHELGTRFDFEVLAENAPPVCGVEIRSWNFSWQRFYFYEQPIAIADASTKLRVTCTYDTSELTEPVYPGHDEGAEMCSLIVYAVPTF